MNVISAHYKVSFIEDIYPMNINRNTAIFYKVGDNG